MSYDKSVLTKRIIGSVGGARAEMKPLPKLATAAHEGIRSAGQPWVNVDVSYTPIDGGEQKRQGPNGMNMMGEMSYRTTVPFTALKDSLTIVSRHIP